MSSDLSPEPWQQAVVGYTNSLSPAQRQAVEAPTTAEECLQILIAHSSRRRAVSQVLDSIRPAIESLTRLAGAIDVVVQMSTGIASPVWGPLRAAIAIASDHLDALERTGFIVNRIASALQRYPDMETLFQSNAGVRRAIGALYGDLLWFCTQVVSHNSLRIRCFIASFENGFGSIVQSIQLHSVAMDLAAATAHMQETGGMRERMLAEAKERSIQQLHDWLYPARVEDDLERYQAEYLPGSVGWVTKSPEFIAWKESQGSAFLQIIGPLGSGKSTLAAQMVQRLREISPGSKVLYFFCDQKNGTKQSLVDVVRTLLAQLLRIDPQIAAPLSLVCQKYGWKTPNAVPTHRDIFSQVMRSYKGENQPIYIVLDAIDECGGQYELLEPFLSTEFDITIKTLLTSRDVPDPAIPVFRTSSILPMNLDASSGYIREYVERRIQSVPHLARSELGAKAITDITSAAGGLWLYARLMVDEIVRAPSQELVMKYLSSLPRSLSDLYTQILRARESQMTPDEWRFAQALFLWVDISNVVPRIWTSSFLAYQYDRLPLHTLQLVFRHVNGGNPVFDAVGLARTLGAPLIRDHQVGSTYGLDFMHKSAYQYLADSVSQPSNDLPLLMHSQKLKTLYRAMTAIWYFADSPDSERDLRDLQEKASPRPRYMLVCDSHFEMSYGIWGVFLQPSYRISNELLSEAEPMLKQIIEFLQTPRCLRWVEISTIVNYSGNYRPLVDNILFALQYLGGDCGPVLERLQETGLSFFRSWLYAVQQSTPWRPYGPQLDLRPGFENSHVTTSILRIAEHWGREYRDQLADRSQAEGEFDMCGECAAIVPTWDIRKHSIICRGGEWMGRHHVFVN